MQLVTPYKNHKGFSNIWYWFDIWITCIPSQLNDTLFHKHLFLRNLEDRFTWFILLGRWRVLTMLYYYALSILTGIDRLCCSIVSWRLNTLLMVFFLSWSNISVLMRVMAASTLSLIKEHLLQKATFETFYSMWSGPCNRYTHSCGYQYKRPQGFKLFLFL